MFYQHMDWKRNTFEVIVVSSKRATGNRKSVMTTGVQINNNKTYLQTFIPTGIKTKFNTCEMYPIARSGLRKVPIFSNNRGMFPHYDNHTASIRSTPKSLHLVDLHHKTKKLQRYFNFFNILIN